MCGLGIDLSVASFEEVSNAIEQQDKKNNSFPSRQIMITIAKKHYPEGSENLKKLLKAFDDAESIDALNDDQLKAIYSKFGG